MSAGINWPQFISEQSRRAQRPDLQAFYRSHCFDPELRVDQAEFIALDFETTGLHADEHEIVSIGLVPFNWNRIYLKEAREWLVRPERTLCPRSVTIHGITHTQLRAAPPFSEVLEPLLAALSGRVVVVHYKYIERDFLYTSVKRLCGETLMFPVIDTLALEVVHHRTRLTSRLKQLLLGRRESVRLADSRERYGLPRYTLHSAKIDALATAELLQAQLKTYYSPATRVRDLWQ